MGNINLSFKNSQNKKQKQTKKEKVILTYHDSIPQSNEYYTFIDKNGHELPFDNKSYIITKISSSKFVAKKTNVSKINLNFVPSKEGVEYKPAYFTYNSEKISLVEDPIYNEETNSYIGKITFTNIHDKEIKLYEE